MRDRAARLLDESRTARLRTLPFTYDAVGATAGVFPAGFATLHRSRVLPADVTFESAVATLMSWRMHAGAGFAVSASSPTVEPDAVVVLGLGLGRLRMKAACRVVDVITEEHRRGFAYGTLPGHPESGEERFVVEHRPDGRVEVTVSAFSRPGNALVRLGGPAVRWGQDLATRRYLHAFDR